MKKGFLTLFLAIMAIPVFAQKITVNGTVIDKQTNEGIIAATVRILSLPDSTMAGGAATDSKGAFKIKSIKKGKYAIKVTYIGYKDKVIPLDLSNATSPFDAGYITLIENSQLLKETVVSANAAQVQVSGDSLVYNASAYRTAEGSALEELVKKLPGAEIDDDGNVTINGKTVTKILVDGKEFFLNDKNIALKNIPTAAIDKIKAYDRKSDLARVTGIDDGEEETVLDLSFKKGMNQGWFGNIDAAIGTKHRYSEKLMLNRFIEHDQFTILGSTNNIGDRGYGGGGGRGGWGRGGNGLSANKQAGFNFATVSDKLETGGNVRFRYDGTDNYNKQSTQNFVTQTGAFTNSISQNYSSNISAGADFRFEWKPDTMTNIIFRPSGNFSRNRGMSNSKRATFNTGSEEDVQTRLDYAEQYVLDSLVEDIVNTNFTYGQTWSRNINANGELQINRKFNNEGRNLTLRSTGGYSDGNSKQLTASNINYHSSLSSTNNNRYYSTPNNSHNVSVQLTYSEPIAYKTYLQFSYTFSYSYSKSNRAASVYGDVLEQYQTLSEALQLNRYDITGALDYMLSHGFEPNYDFYTDSIANRLSQYSVYKNYNHRAAISFRKVGDQYNLSVGVEFLPQHSTLDYKYMGKEYPRVIRNVYNFTPSLDFRYDFNKQTQFRATYRGRTSQPSMTNLLEITDDSDPLNISKGNSGLKPSFSHNIRLNYNTYNVDLQQGIFTWGNLNFTQNRISNETRYDSETGVRTTTPQNINGNWNGNVGFGYNRGLGEKKYFNVSSFTMFNYSHNVSYYFVQDKVLMANFNLTEPSSVKSKTNQTGINERLSFGYRRDWFEASVNGNVNYNHSRNNVVSTNNLDTWNFSYGAEFNFNFDNGFSISTDISESSRRGYATTSMNTNELLWNAQISKSFLKGKALTISAQWNDILAQRSNISRTISDISSSDTEYNAIYSYGMIHVIYKLNIFGGKNANGTPNERQMGGFGPGGGRRGGGGGGRGPR